MNKTTLNKSEWLDFDPVVKLPVNETIQKAIENAIIRKILIDKKIAEEYMALFDLEAHEIEMCEDVSSGKVYFRKKEK